MEELLEISYSLIGRTSLSFERYLKDKIAWDEKLIGIKGARGTGKTTLILQYLKRKKDEGFQVTYFSLDELFFLENSLVETAKAFYQNGGKILALDEVHKYPGWSREIKNLHDRYSDLQIIFSGSSIIDISKVEGDISRRAIIYELHGLSFREYLLFKKNLVLPLLSLEQIVSSTNDLRSFFPNDFKPISFFKEYLVTGYFPFSGKNEDLYFQKLRQMIRTIVEYDMAEIKGFDIRNGKKLLQLLYIVAQQVPFKPNLSSLASKTSIHRNSLSLYLQYLAEARLLELLYPEGISVSTLQKPEKIFINNTNYLFALAEKSPEIGSVREIFFQSQIKVNHQINYSKTVDFLVDKSFHFEIGGKNKSRKQLISEDHFLVKDDLEYPVGQNIPLWVFGFLY
ncbi:AAA family ATPase [uncultured Algoriphagus sp.]|uniref:ATP-binding protein n=1 Tax=uncultured Algoriphagus sp. TaxID=417365 RepID=UPI00258CBB25|nr:AAA family ATPase [uncultured Algoriphagus sp.]